MVVDSDAPRRSVYVETIDQPPSSKEDGAGLMEVWQLVRHHWLLILSIGVLGALAGVGLTVYQTPQYRASATLEVQPPASNTMGFTSAQPEGATGGAPDSYVRTQTKILLSKTLEDRVLGKLAATNRLSSYTAPDRMERLRKLFHLPSQHAAASASNEPAHVPSFTMTVDSDTTRILDLICESTDPAFAADYVNTVAEEFGQLQMEAHWESVRKTTAWLNGQLAEAKRKLEDSEAKLQEYAASSSILTTDGKDGFAEDKLKEIQHELSVASAARIQTQSIFQVASRSLPASGVPHVADNAELAKLRQQLVEAREIYTDENSKVKQLRALIKIQEDALTGEKSSAMDKIRDDYTAAQLREDVLTKEYKNQSDIVMDRASRYTKYNILKREVDTDSELYGALLQKVRESGVASAFSASNVRLVDPAGVPTDPFRPRLSVNVLGGFLGALVLGVCLVILGDQVNRSLNLPGESTLHLHVPELGVIPAYDTSVEMLPRGTARTIGNLEAGKKGESFELALRNDAQSLVAESFRNVLTSILLSDSAEHRPRVIVVTAAGRQAGKSSSVSNLALALAEIGHKVLVIDADLRRPRQHNIFETSNTWGLSDILQERTALKDMPLEALARPLEPKGLYLLPAGPACHNVSSVLYSERVGELLQRVRREFDTILIDTPPVLMVADARIMGRLADAAILVIRAGETTRDVAFQAKQRLVDDGITVLGSILNHWRVKGKGRNYNYGATSSR
jgi:capsular exopolysaccharide synthesis family protein